MKNSGEEDANQTANKTSTLKMDFAYVKMGITKSMGNAWFNAVIGKPGMERNVSVLKDILDIILENVNSALLILSK